MGICDANVKKRVQSCPGTVFFFGFCLRAQGDRGCVVFVISGWGIAKDLRISEHTHQYHPTETFTKHISTPLTWATIQISASIREAFAILHAGLRTVVSYRFGKIDRYLQYALRWTRVCKWKSAWPRLRAKRRCWVSYKWENIACTTRYIRSRNNSNLGYLSQQRFLYHKPERLALP